MDSDGTTQLEVMYNHTDSVIQVGTDATSAIPIMENKTFYAGEYDKGDGEGSLDRITEYTLTFTGFNHHISRKGNFLDLSDNVAGDGKTLPDLSASEYDGTDGYADDDEELYTWYGGGETVTVTIYPAPNTGEIHFVPNDFEL